MGREASSQGTNLENGLGDGRRAQTKADAVVVCPAKAPGVTTMVGSGVVVPGRPMPGPPGKPERAPKGHGMKRDRCESLPLFWGPQASSGVSSTTCASGERVAETPTRPLKTNFLSIGRRIGRLEVAARATQGAKGGGIRFQPRASQPEASRSKRPSSYGRPSRSMPIGTPFGASGVGVE